MEEMAASIQTVAANAQSLATYVEETSSSINEMGASIEDAAAFQTSIGVFTLVFAALYTAVAEVMAYIYQLNQYMALGMSGGVAMPVPPAAVAVPDGLDPGAVD